MTSTRVGNTSPEVGRRGSSTSVWGQIFGRTQKAGIWADSGNRIRTRSQKVCLRRIKMRRLRPFSSESKLYEAESGHRWRPPFGRRLRFPAHCPAFSRVLSPGTRPNAVRLWPSVYRKLADHRSARLIVPPLRSHRSLPRSGRTCAKIGRFDPKLVQRILGPTPVDLAPYLAKDLLNIAELGAQDCSTSVERGRRTCTEPGHFRPNSSRCRAISTDFGSVWAEICGHFARAGLVPEGVVHQLRTNTHSCVRVCM